MSAVKVTFADRAMQSYLTELIASTQDASQMMSDIREHLAETTKRRFDTSTSPDGDKWKLNKDTTVLNYLGVFKGSRMKDGSLEPPRVSWRPIGLNHATVEARSASCR